MYDLVLQGGLIIDPRNDVQMIGDVGIDDELIVDVSQRLDPSKARRVIDVTGLVVIPGIIDPHVHLSGRFGSAAGCQMMAAVGVTTAIDLAGDANGICEALAQHGSGISIGYVSPIIPGESVSGRDPGPSEVSSRIEEVLEEGSLGVKVLGGHYPLTPEATARIIETAHEHQCHIAVHAGTTRTGSNILGLEEAIQLSEGRRFHLAHINSYCRGQVGPPLIEVNRALDALRKAPHVVSESYMAQINGTSGLCEGAVPKSQVTRASLRAKGYTDDEAGLEQAVFSGDAQVHAVRGGVTQLVGGQEGVDLWRSRGTATAVSFSINPPEVTFALACAKTEDRFVVTAFGTDGGSMPRNTTVEQGLAMVRYGAMTIQDFVLKTSWGPAHMFGLEQKADLRIGTDADITVLDLERGRAFMSLSHGKVIMVDGVVVGEGGRWLVTNRAKISGPEREGVSVRVVDPTTAIPR